MPLKFRLKGLAETFVERLTCNCCGNDGGDDGDEFFNTDLSRVTYEGIIAVVQCEICKYIFVPGDQRLGIINPSKLRDAVQSDSERTGEPVLASLEAVKLDVERLNASIRDSIH